MLKVLKSSSVFHLGPQAEIPRAGRMTGRYRNKQIYRNETALRTEDDAKSYTFAAFSSSR